MEHLLATDEDLSKVLVFVGSKKTADRLIEHIGSKFPEKIGVIHSNKSQNYRINALKQFQEGTHRVLIATDVAARGLDILDVTHVVNFDIPEVPGDYIHRIGRTGRADKAGIAISFINEPEKVFQLEIEQLMIFPSRWNAGCGDLFREKGLAGENREHRRRRPDAARHAGGVPGLSSARIPSAACRRRGSRARSTNIWSTRCAAMPKANAPTTPR